MDSLVLKLTVDDLPRQFKYEIVCIDEDMTIIRSNLKSMNDINQWVFEFGELTNTRWISRNSDPQGERFVCWKKFVCYRAPYKKRISITNTDCDAFLYIKIKRNIPDVVVEDSYVQMGLPAEIRIKNQHTHDIAGDVIRYRRNRMYQEVKYKFFDYFDAGLGVRESWLYHQRMLLKEYSPKELDLCQLFPSQRAVRYWRELWRQVNFKPGQTSYQSRFDSTLIKESLTTAHNNESELLSEVDPQDPEKETIEDIICLMRMYDAQFGSSSTGLKILKHRLLTIHGRSSWETFLRSAGNKTWPHQGEAEFSSRNSSLSNRKTNKRNGGKHSASLPNADFSHHSEEESDDIEILSPPLYALSAAERVCSLREDGPSSLTYELSDIEDEVSIANSPSTEDCMQLSEKNKIVSKSTILFPRKPVSASKRCDIDHSSVKETLRTVQSKRKARQITTIDISHLSPKDSSGFDLPRISVLPVSTDTCASATSSPAQKVMKAKKSFASKRTVSGENTKVRILAVSHSSHATARKQAIVIKV